MAIIEGGSSGALVGVGAEAAAPLHTARYSIPYGAGGVFRAGAVSGTMAAALAANAELFQFRYVTGASRIALIHSISISAGANAAATAAGLVKFVATIARAWTVAGTGGTRLTLTGDNVNLRTAMSGSEVNDAGIATTGALTAGTKTLDSTNIGIVAIGIGTGAITTAASLNLLPQTDLFRADVDGGYPIVLANQEGFVIRNGATAWPAAMTWHFAVNVQWSEVPAY